MIIFIDESGDLGQNISKGSSRIFVIVMIIFKKNSNIESTSSKINKLRKLMRKSNSYEFKFNKMRKSERIKFLESVKKEKFDIRVMIVIKESISAKNIRRFDYGSLLEMLLIRNEDIIKNADIRLDKIGGKEYKKSINVYLRKKLKRNSVPPMIKEFRFVDSKSNNLIQLADIIAGSINRYYQDNKEDSRLYREIIKGRIEDEWIVE